MISLSHRTKIILAYSAIYFVWGSTFLGVHVALKSFPPFLLSALRLLIAGIALSVFCMMKREPFPLYSDLRKNALWGLVIFIGGIVAVVWAQQFISSSLASAIITTPFWFIVLDRKQWRYYFSNRWILTGLTLGLGGVILLMSFKSGRTATTSELMQTLAILIIVGGSFMWVWGALQLRYNPSKASVYVATAIQLLSAGIFCCILSLLSDELRNFKIVNIHTDSLIALLYLAIVSSLIGFLSFVWLIKVQPPAIVSTYSYINPLVATLLGWAFADEHISVVQMIALGVILLGVLFVNIPRYSVGGK